MTEHRIATLAMRIFGLFIIFRGLSVVLQLIEIFARSRSLSFLVGSGLVSSLVMIALGVVVWHRAEWLATRALPVGEEQTSGRDAERPALTMRTVLVVAFVILGVYLLTIAVSHTTTAAGFWFEAGRIEEAGSIETPGTETSVGTVQFTQDMESTYRQQAREEAYTAAGFGIGGIILLLGARGLGTFFTRSWWAGDDDGPSGEDEMTEVEVQEWPDDA